MTMPARLLNDDQIELVDGKFKCQLSGLLVERRAHLPRANGRGARRGCFADVNCLLRFLEDAKPRGWQKYAAEVRQMYPTIVPAPPAGLGWKIGDERAQEPLMFDSEHVSDFKARMRRKRIQAQRREFDAKRKRDEPAAVEAAPVSVPEPPPPQAVIVPEYVARLAPEVVIVRGGKREILSCDADDWLRRLSDVLGTPLTHAMPAFIAAGGAEFTLYPTLLCDPRCVAAAADEASVTVKFRRFSMQ